MGTVRVGRNTINPTHVFSLSDGDKTLGFLTCNRKGEISLNEGWRQSPMPRTALKMSQGQAKYEDFELPFTSIIQDDFSGGMLAEDFEDDRTKYRDGRHCDTSKGDVICGPNPTEIPVMDPVTMGDLDFYGTEISTTYKNFASPIVADKTMLVDTVQARASIFTIPPTNKTTTELHVQIRADNAGAPGTVLASGELKNINNYAVWDVPLAAPVNITSGTTYWVCVVYYNSYEPTYDKYASYWYEDAAGQIWGLKISDSTWERTTVATSWGADEGTLSFMLVSSVEPRRIRYFEHRRCLYALASYTNGVTNAKLYQNGYRGAATSNTADKSKLNTKLDLSVDMNGDTLDLTGCIALIIEGPGSEEEQPWRKISGNTTTGTNDVISVDLPWIIDHTTATSFVILGTDDWWEIGTTGLGTRVTDVCIVYDYVAIAQGKDDPIRKFMWTNNAGTGTNNFKDDGTNKADLLLMVADTNGNMKLWKAMIANNIVDYAPAKSYATDHTFAAKNIKIGTSTYDDIKNMIAYGDPLIPYVIKENSFGSIQNDIYAEIPLGELDEIRSSYNGIAAMKHGVYLYFNLGEMIERYYDRRLDDVGLTRGEGLPEGRKGIVRKLLPYPGRYYALIYSEGNIPSIQCFNGIGWHEVWRPTNVVRDASKPPELFPFAYDVTDLSNSKCTDMIVQVIPGNIPDRLWFDNNGKLVWIPITINPRQDSEYSYRGFSQIETAWHYGNLKDVNKYWHSIKLHTENLSTSTRGVRVDYKVDEDTDWTNAGEIFTSPIEELDLSSSNNVTGYRIKFRFTLLTSSTSISPRILAYVIKGVIRVGVKKGWNVTCISENETDLNGDADESGNLLEQLDLWANSESMAKPLTLRHNIGYYDDKRVFIDPASVALQQVRLAPEGGSPEREYKELLSFTMYEA